MGDMRFRSVLVAFVAVMLFPGVASALCLVEPFDKVVRSSDAVLIAKVDDATVRNGRILLQLNVDDALKGSPADGARVWYGSCGPFMSPEGARQIAGDLIGTRGLYLLKQNRDGSFSQYSGVTEPQQMSLVESISRAREVLGVVAQSAEQGSQMPVLLPVLIIVGVAILIGIWKLLAHRRS